MKTNNVEIIKTDSLVRRRGVNVEKYLKRGCCLLPSEF